MTDAVICLLSVILFSYSDKTERFLGLPQYAIQLLVVKTCLDGKHGKSNLHVFKQRNVITTIKTVKVVLIQQHHVGICMLI